MTTSLRGHRRPRTRAGTPSIRLDALTGKEPIAAGIRAGVERSRRTATTRLRTATALAVAITLPAASGCSYGGINDVDLPFRQGTGQDSYTITVEMEQATGLTKNGEVKVDDVTVGTIQDMRVDDWRAVLTVGLNEDVVLPANAVARVGQKSLLGAKYLEIDAPTATASSGRRLSHGDTIDVESTATYPDTEQVLSALAVVLNGSGLQQVRTITKELNQVLDGRESQVRALFGRFNDLVGALAAQRTELVDLLDRLEGTTRTLGQDKVLARALDTLPEALAQLDDDRADITRTLTAVADLGDIGTAVINESGGDLKANLNQLRPVLNRLATSGTDIADALSVLVSFPFPSNTSFPEMFRGDYGNLFLTLDVSPDLLARNFAEGFGLVGNNDSLLNLPPLGAGDDPSSPLDPFLPQIRGLPTLPDASPLPGVLGGLFGGQAGGTNGGHRRDADAPRAGNTASGWSANTSGAGLIADLLSPRLTAQSGLSKDSTRKHPDSDSAGPTTIPQQGSATTIDGSEGEGDR